MAIDFELTRRRMKSIRIRVVPPGRVLVSAPLHLPQRSINHTVAQHAAWIAQQQAVFLADPARYREPDYITGEQHPLWGRLYNLDVIEQAGKARVIKTDESSLTLFTKTGSGRAQRKTLLSAFYRQQIKQQIQQLLPPWQARLGVQVNDWGVKQMKTRWGSCNTAAGRVWLNLELAKYPVACLESVLVHELVHLLERSHNHRFKAYMDQFLPDWREREARLRQSPA